jgi:hypothetical protein
MPEFNEQLARNALKAIEHSPERWNQSEWRCGTGMCFAGFVAFEAGAEWADLYDEYDMDMITPKGRIQDVVDFALEALGYDDPESDSASYIEATLFGACNTLEDLKELVDELSGK